MLYTVAFSMWSMCATKMCTTNNDYTFLIPQDLPQMNSFSSFKINITNNCTNILQKSHWFKNYSAFSTRSICSACVPLLNLCSFTEGGLRPHEAPSSFSEDLLLLN